MQGPLKSISLREGDRESQSVISTTRDSFQEFKSTTHGFNGQLQVSGGLNDGFAISSPSESSTSASVPEQGLDYALAPAGPLGARGDLLHVHHAGRASDHLQATWMKLGRSGPGAFSLFKAWATSDSIHAKVNVAVNSSMMYHVFPYIDII